MNQAIQFPDREEWDENKMCMFSRSREWHATDMCDLWRESGVSFTGDTPEQWLASFRQHRWDLEEEAET